MRRILVMDDDSHTRRAIGAWLSRYGFGVAMAEGSASGPAALGETSFDLTIVDIIDAWLSEAEPDRPQAAALATITASARPDRGSASREDSNERAGMG